MITDTVIREFTYDAITNKFTVKISTVEDNDPSTVTNSNVDYNCDISNEDLNTLKNIFNKIQMYNTRENLSNLHAFSEVFRDISPIPISSERMLALSWVIEQINNHKLNKETEHLTIKLDKDSTPDIVKMNKKYIIDSLMYKYSIDSEDENKIKIYWDTPLKRELITEKMLIKNKMILDNAEFNVEMNDEEIKTGSEKLISKFTDEMKKFKEKGKENGAVIFSFNDSANNEEIEYFCNKQCRRNLFNELYELGCIVLLRWDHFIVAW